MRRVNLHASHATPMALIRSTPGALVIAHIVTFHIPGGRGDSKTHSTNGEQHNYCRIGKREGCEGREGGGGDGRGGGDHGSG